ncbi:helix-turn-helix domain-containing protein [Actinokineospora sp.]|uniref:helix-turn-helix domain-containing protein n=1 Tax=Actinokineospora sp. TaxID=1872133 RepID=UPI0040377C8C
MPGDPTKIELRRRAFAVQLRRIRTDQGLTQEQVAHDAGMDRSFYVDIENARHSVSVDKVFAISDAIGVSIEEIFRGLS